LISTQRASRAFGQLIVPPTLRELGAIGKTRHSPGTPFVVGHQSPCSSASTAIVAPGDRASFAWRLPLIRYLVGEREQLVWNYNPDSADAHGQIATINLKLISIYRLGFGGYSPKSIS
jgi:hypothetical protein